VASPPPKADRWITTSRNGFPLLCALIRVEARHLRFSPRRNIATRDSFLCMASPTYGICLRPLQGFVLGRQESAAAARASVQAAGSEANTSGGGLHAASALSLLRERRVQGLSDQLGAGLAVRLASW